MRRSLTAIAIIIAVLFVGALAYGAWKSPEKLTLDTAARAGSSGKFVTLTPGTTHYEVTGPDSGRVVVLVHGFSVPYYIWDSTVAGLTAAGHRVVRYDLYGRGWSDRPDVEYDGSLYDAQLGELLDSLRITGPVDLVGLSFGGFVTAHFVASHPERVRTLTLIDPMAEPSVLPWALRLPLIGPWIWKVMHVPGMADNQLSDFLHPELHPTWPDQYRPQMRYRGFGRSLLSTVAMASRVDFDTLYARAGRTGVPALLIWGRQDQVVPLALAEVVRRGIPSVEFVPVESAGHLPHIEQAQVVNARLRDFWAVH